MNQTTEWILTDDGNMPQWVKEMNKTTYMVVEIDPIWGVFYIKENTINVDDYNEKEILSELEPFGYKTVEEIEGEMKNQIIAECFAENRSPGTSDKHHKCHTSQDVKVLLEKEYGIHVEETLGMEWFKDFEEEE